MKILVAEGDPVQAARYERALIHAGYEVDIATRGDRALALALQRDYDALIADVTLSLVDGVTIVEAIRSKRPLLPVLLVAGGTQRERALEGEDGPTRVLPKTCSSQALLAALATVRRNSERLRVSRT